MINEIYIDNFRCLTNFRIKPGDFQLWLGDNGSGKTSVPDALRCVQRLMRGEHVNELIAYIIPKWHIQTWIAYLDGENVDEADKTTYKKMYGKISELKDVHPFIDRLADNCRENKQLESPPDSLVATCQEFN